MAPPSPRSYRAVVQDFVSLDDKQWVYCLASLPSASQTNAVGLVKSIALSTNDCRHQIDLSFLPASPSRAISSYPLDRFLAISFAGFRPLYNQSTEIVGTQPSTPGECTDYIIGLLRSGVCINGVLYNFFGHSNSQLKSRTCLLFAASKEEIKKEVDAMGDFDKMKTVQKKAKRIGLLFSTAHAVLPVDPSRCQDIPDIETADYVFTDGCGLIAPHLARDLARRMRIAFRNVRYTPSVFQIRYRGYKGVVTLDPSMKGRETLLRLRKSMRKFTGATDYGFSVVEYSKPYGFGHLNDEVIILLHSLGITSEILLRKQQEHFSFLASAVADPHAAFRFLTYVNQYDLAERVLLESLENVRPQVAALVNAEFAKMIKPRYDEQRCRILIPKSRLLFGVCDAWGVLKEGECHVRVTLDGDGSPVTLVGTSVIVTRNPCLHPGDLQKFRTVQRPELSHLVDCIVFSTKGKRPAADLMSGGDLDGDKFFVSWDQDIIPSTLSQAAEYPAAKESISFKPITDDDRLVYFARYTNASLGRVKNLYLGWAASFGPMSPQCQELNRLFSTCVDGNRVKIPPRLENPPEPSPEAPPFVLGHLHDTAKAFARSHEHHVVSSELSCDGYDFDAMAMLICRGDLAVSEFELLQFTYRWCLRNGASLGEFAHFFDFALLSAEEKTWALAHMPVSSDYPSLVRNALCQSDLLQESELSDFKLNYPCLRWKRFYASSRDRPASFLEKAATALHLFHRKLILLQVDDRLTIAIYIPQQVQPAKDYRIGDRARLFAFPRSQGKQTSSRLSLPTKANYQVYCDNNVFQLFEGRRQNTWVFVGRSASDDSSYRNLESESSRRRMRQATVTSGVNFDFRASIALDKFSKRLQTHVGRVNRNGVLGSEIYVISNKDVDALRDLDLWLEYVDTREEIPLFERNAKEHARPTVKDVDWKAVPEYIVQVALHQRFPILLDLDNQGHYEKLFSFLLKHNEKETLLDCFTFLLTTFQQDFSGTVRADLVLAEMLSFLRDCPFLAVAFSRLDWTILPSQLVEVLDSRVEDILRAIIISANDVGQMMLEPFKQILSKARVLSISAYARLAEIVALAVESPSLALDIMLGGLEQESSRLVPERPTLTRRITHLLNGITINHVEEAAEQYYDRPDLLSLKRLCDTEDGWPVVRADFRLDSSGGTPRTSTHVRLTEASPPSNSSTARLLSMSALVIRSSPGQAEFQCFHPVPAYLEDCSWRLSCGGPFVTTKAMFDATVDLALGIRNANEITELVLGTEVCLRSKAEDGAPALTPRKTLNERQNKGVESASNHSLTCLWGPPGTGKTHTIVEIIRQLQIRHPKSRILVSAPTHNAVDNVMRRYVSNHVDGDHMILPIRVSTEVRKVSDDLLKYTCDAMAGQEVHSSHAALRKATEMVKQARIVFTTCIGAALGVLRREKFDIVIIDEASQQTEPASLVPLTKGCTKAVLVGDHVQLRPTVGQLSLSLDFDISLFERLWTAQEHRGVQRVMLDTQYRMHEDVCRFSSEMFYDGNLRTGIKASERPMPPSTFPWPLIEDSPRPKALGTEARHHRMVFIESAAPEDLGQKSKCNRGQAAVCVKVCKLLTEVAPGLPKFGSSAETPKPVIAVLTPYSRQVGLLKQNLSSNNLVEVCSIDSFQGREADVIVFVTVRCNQRCEIGFLSDLRRLNVVLTRARTGVIIIGNRATLSGAPVSEECARTWKRLIDTTKDVKVSEAAHGDRGNQ